MATGTGKTFTAFQIAYKLWNAGLKKKILYLADRNILIDQTMQQDFKPFEDVMTKISHKNTFIRNYPNRISTNSIGRKYRNNNIYNYFYDIRTKRLLNMEIWL